jgi:hypothetical protein
MAWWQFDKPGIIDNDISAANANLIAAAPELYEALEELLDWQNGVPLDTPKYRKGWGGAVEKAKAALKKARGE